MLGVRSATSPCTASSCGHHDLGLGQPSGAIRQTRHSLEEADVDGMVQVSQADFFNLRPPTDSGVVVMNLPTASASTLGTSWACTRALATG